MINKIVKHKELLNELIESRMELRQIIKVEIIEFKK